MDYYRFYRIYIRWYLYKPRPLVMSIELNRLVNFAWLSLDKMFGVVKQDHILLGGAYHKSEVGWYKLSYIVHPSCNWTSRTCPVSDRFFVQTHLAGMNPRTNDQVGKVLVAPWLPIFCGIWIAIATNSSFLSTRSPNIFQIDEIFWFRTPNTLVYFKRTWLYTTYKLGEIIS